MRYQHKRVAAWLLSNPQSLRWVTQGVVLRRLWQGRVNPTHYCLDVGCGGGSYAIENFLRAGAKAELTDYDDTLLGLAKRQVAEAGFHAQAGFAQASAEALPYADQSFDRVQCLEVLEHLPDPGAALREFHRVCRPDALLVASTPQPPEWFDNPGHVVEGYTPAELSAILRGAGWEPVENEACMLLGFRLAAGLLQLTRGLPLPLNPLVALENWVPRSWRQRCLPYDVVVLARRRQDANNP